MTGRCGGSRWLRGRDPPAAVADVEGAPLFGAFGHMNASKRVPQLLRAFARYRLTNPDARLVLAGSADPALELEWRIEQAGLADAVVREDYVPEERLWALLRRVDACDRVARADDGRDVCGRHPRTLRRHAARRLRRRLVLGAAGRRRAEGRAGRARGATHSSRRSTTLSTPGVREAMGARARELAETRARPRARRGSLRGGARGGRARPGGQRRTLLTDASVTHADVGVRAFARAVPVWAWLAALVAVSAGIRFVLARGMVAPWIMVDELVYSELAKSFAANGHFEIRGVSSGGSYGFVYPLLISAAYRLFDAVPDAYAVREGDQLGRHVARGDPCVLPGAPRAEAAVRARRRRALGRDPVAALHGDAHDRERVLSGLPLRRARARADARAADARQPTRRARSLRARVCDATAGPRALRCGVDCAAAARPARGSGGSARCTSPQACSRSSRWSSRRRAAGRRSRCSAPTRPPGITATRSAPLRSGCSGTSRSSTCISASFPSRPSSCSRSRGGRSTRRSARSWPARAR